MSHNTTPDITLGYRDLNVADRSDNINAATAGVFTWEVCGHAIR
jgi:hypothetical protein